VVKTITDIPTALIEIETILVLIYLKKIKEPVIIGIAATLGVLIKLII